MRKIWNKGHRIRASDKHLVYHFSIGTLLFVFVAVLLLLNIKQLMRTDWEHFSLLENGLTLCPYNFITILIATGVCALVAFGYYRFCYDSFKKLLHRQKLARMVLENKWYEADTVQDSGFFTDLQSRSREKIVWFPKIYYQMEKGLLHIRCEITLGKYQDQLLRLEDKLESGLYCELTDKTLHDGYIEYTLLYDMIANRITIDEVRAENGCLRLMKNLVWEYDALPHALIAGGTGGGKTYFLLILIEALLHTNAVLYILDPKNADLADFSKYSLGMKQRLGIANAILHDPELLILDEPTNGLDPIGIAEVRNFIKNLSVERGKTILISSHILSEISLLADDIGIIDHGVLLEESSMDELEKKNRKYIQLQVSDIPKASLILERQFHVTDYAVQDEHNLRLYDTALDMAAINKALVVQDVAVISSQICNDTLEDYFKQITGGEGIA